jgi:hypothetical protein
MMRRLTLALVMATLTAAPTWAGPTASSDRTIQCISAGGQLIPKSCDVADGRLVDRERICTCPLGGVRVEVPICGKGQHPPGESKALNIARRTGARDSSLVGDTVNGRPICATVGERKQGS